MVMFPSYVSLPEGISYVVYVIPLELEESWSKYEY